MPRALCLQHADVEHAGGFAVWWAQAGLELEIVREYDGETLPADPTRWDALVVLGGPQSVCAAGEVSDAELSLVRAAVDNSLPMLGICLGAQVLAAATGGAVAKGNGPEHGVGTVALTEAVATDPLLKTLGAGEREVVQWHGDGITALPPGAVLLASSERYPVQAFRVGTAAWGFQFHAEADADMVTTWAEHDGVDATALLPDVLNLKLEPDWRPVADAFARLARS